MGTSHLLWELERLKEVKGYEGMYNTWKMMVEDGTHFLAQRSVSMDGFYQAPNDDVHSSRMQGMILAPYHMELMDHIHMTISMIIFSRSYETSTSYPCYGCSQTSSYNCSR